MGRHGEGAGHEERHEPRCKAWDTMRREPPLEASAAGAGVRTLACPDIRALDVLYVQRNNPCGTRPDRARTGTVTPCTSWVDLFVGEGGLTVVRVCTLHIFFLLTV
jgi:hypothetical protein